MLDPVVLGNNQSKDWSVPYIEVCVCISISINTTPAMQTFPLQWT